MSEFAIEVNKSPYVIEVLAQGPPGPQGEPGGGFDDQSANRIFAGPSSGANAQPAFRALVTADIPNLASVYALASHNHDGVYQPNSTELAALAALDSTGFVKRTGANTYTAAALSSGEIPDLSAVYAVIGHSHSGVYEPANANIQAHIARTDNPHGVTAAQLGLVIGTHVQAYDADLSAIAALAGSGYLSRASDGSWSLGSVSGGVALGDSPTWTGAHRIQTSSANAFSVGSSAGTTHFNVATNGPGVVSINSTSNIPFTVTSSHGESTCFQLSNTATNGRSWLFFSAATNGVGNGAFGIYDLTGARGIASFAPASSNGSLALGAGALFGFSSGSDAAYQNLDTVMGRAAAANFRFGATDAASPVAQFLSVQNVAAGTANTSGVNWTRRASRGTGTGNGGAHVWQVAPAGSTGSTQNALTEVFRLGTSSTNAAISFFGGSVAAKQTVTGSRGGNAALANLLTALATYGLITDSTSA